MILVVLAGLPTPLREHDAAGKRGLLTVCAREVRLDAGGLGGSDAPEGAPGPP
jgi:hypothetical protein